MSHENIAKLWIVTGEDQYALMEAALEGLSGYELVAGGETRQQSVYNGLTAIRNAGGCDKILIHDAARPFLSHIVIDRLLQALEDHQAAIPVLPTVDTTITLDDDFLGAAIDRSEIWRVQTPQVFDFVKLLAAHNEYPGDQPATDDSQIFRLAGYQVATVEGDERLMKFTKPENFKSAVGADGADMAEMRTGTGFDVHQLVTGEELWIGGIKLEHDKGLAGHSDADVLLHALTDALLGAIGAGDIGDHFPPTDPQWKGTKSTEFVEYAARLIAAKGGRINNVDMTLICEAPKIKPHRENIRANIAKMLDLSMERVSVKATTTEGLGFTGRKEGIAAQAMATITMEAL